MSRSLARPPPLWPPHHLQPLATLTALVEHGLEPDRFLSGAEHPALSSTSLLVVLVRNYDAALRAAAGRSGAASAAAGGSLPPTPGPNAIIETEVVTSSGGSGNAANGMPGANGRWPLGGGGGGGGLGLGAGVGGGADLVSVMHSALNTMVAVLLEHGALVDEPPRRHFPQVGPGWRVAVRQCAHGCVGGG